MDDQHFCLKWNNYQDTITRTFDQLLQKEAFVDATLFVEGQLLKAHKTILSACSPYFEKMFTENTHPHPIIFLKDFSYDDIKMLLAFMYKGEVNVSQTRLSNFLKAAETLKVRGLSDDKTRDCGAKKDKLEEDLDPLDSASPAPPPKRRRETPRVTENNHESVSPPEALSTTAMSEERLTNSSSTVPAAESEVTNRLSDINSMTDDQGNDNGSESPPADVSLSRIKEEPELKDLIEIEEFDEDQSNSESQYLDMNEGDLSGSDLITGDPVSGNYLYNQSSGSTVPTDGGEGTSSGGRRQPGPIGMFLPLESGKKQCKLCGKVVNRYRNHYYKHFPDNFRCVFCFNVYTRRDNFRTHLKIVHGYTGSISSFPRSCPNDI